MNMSGHANHMNMSGHANHMNMSGQSNVTTMMSPHGNHMGTTMDHSMHSTKMNHHGNSNGGSLHDGMGMQMVFTFVWKESQVLFAQWELNEEWQLALTCVFLAILASLYEGLKVLREHLLVSYNKKHQQSPSVCPDPKSGEGSQEQVILENGGSISKRMCNWMHVVQTFLHMLQVTLSYFLMLIFMTYNVYLCISVVLGAGIGYFLFGWKRAVIIDSNEHCH